MLRKILQPFYTAFALLTFLAGFFITFPFYLAIGMRNSAGARRTIYLIVTGWAKIWLFLNGMPLQKIGKLPPPGRYIVVANHISYLDTIVLFPALPSYFRALGKKEFSKIPLIGFLYKQIAIMVDRSSPESRTKSMRLMWRVLKHEADIIIFPEGTFNETGQPLKEFYSGAFRLAIDTKTPILPIIFPDTYERWHYSAWWKLWPGRNRAVYLDPVSVSGMTMEDAPMLKEKIYTLMQTALIKYRASS